MTRSYFSASIQSFCTASKQEILGVLAQNSGFDIIQNQRDAWAMQIDLLRPLLIGLEGKIYFEYSIPRMGKRIDVLLAIRQGFLCWSSRWVANLTRKRPSIRCGIMLWI